MEFTMKKLLAIFAVLMLVTYFGYATEDNCHASAYGTFYFTVEQAIHITAEVGTVELGGVCPGCYKNLDGKCLVWNVTGGPDCYWEIYDLNVGTWPTGITHRQVLQTGQGGQFSDYVLGGDLKMDKGWQVRKCVTYIEADCLIPPGDYNVTETVYVQYVCD